MSLRVILLAAAAVLICASAQAGVFDMGPGLTDLELVTVGDPGNAPDDTGWGAVGYEYRIGIYEVTNGQYLEFLNAVGATDTYGLYNTAFETEVDGGIVRSGSEGSYTYGPKNGDPNWLNRPVTRATFWDACRFVNWLHNGQPSGPQDATTTEDGAYALNGYTGADGNWITRNADARFWIPSEDEWYKAAYYDPGLNGGSGGYWEFPTGTDSLLNNNPPDQDDGNSANFCQDGVGDLAVGAPYYSTEVGAYQLSHSPLGTFDQAGNAAEWTESMTDPPDRRERGAHWSTYHSAQAHMSAPGYPHMDEPPDFGTGFRIGAVPEPATLSLLALGGLAMLKRRRR